MKKAIVFGLAVVAVGCLTASANLVAITGMTGSNGGDQYGNGMPSLTNGSGIDKTVDANDPSTWTMSGGSYQDEWMPWYFKDGGGAVTNGANGKIAWASFDVGSSTPLQTLYLFNSNYSGGGTGVDTYNVYYADTPTVALPAQPNKNAFATTGLDPQGDYDFSSGGWTQLNTSGVLTLPKSGVGTVDLTGVTARYIAVEAITNYGDTYKGGRSGLDEVAITQVPEPASLSMLGLVGLALVLRRRLRG